MFENELYKLIDSISFSILILLLVLYALYWYFKTYTLLYQQQGYLDYVYNMKSYELEYKKALLDYKFKIKELKRRK